MSHARECRGKEVVAAAMWRGPRIKIASTMDSGAASSDCGDGDDAAAPAAAAAVVVVVASGGTSSADCQGLTAGLIDGPGCPWSDCFLRLPAAGFASPSPRAVSS